jgi:pimeloyl-ACP methyl ester carboxylesterase
VTVFALVHGGAHGGWCWDLLVPELEARGHQAVAPDLPIDDESAGARAWADVVVGALKQAGATDDVVVVGHSLGGLCVPVVAALRPVRTMVFLGAMVPVPGRAIEDILAEEPDALVFELGAGEPVDAIDERGPSGLAWEAARRGFYQDCDEPVARWAWARLRPQASTVFTERCPLDAWPDVPSVSVVMADDRAVGPDWSRRTARDRLHATLVELPGGHSPFLSRPGALADLLVEVADGSPGRRLVG